MFTQTLSIKLLLEWGLDIELSGNGLDYHLNTKKLDLISHLSTHIGLRKIGDMLSSQTR